MKRRVFLGSALALAAGASRSQAQPGGRIVRVGWITVQSAVSLAPYVEAFRSALAAHGYVEGRNFALELRYADGAAERVAGLVEQLLGLPVDVLVAQGAAAFELRKLAAPVPVVFVMSADPVVAGFADSLARPRGNMTGVTLMAVELNGKRLELLREIVPGLQRVAIVGNPEHPGAQLERAFSEDTGRRLGLGIDYLPTATRAELDGVLARMATRPPQAVSLLADGFAIENRERIFEVTGRQRIPVISGWPVFARSGAVCTYGPRQSESYRRLADYVDRVLKGVKATDLPIERPTQFELVVNVKAARVLGVTIPQSILVRADEVIR